MSAETLLRAATEIREEWGDGGPSPMGTAWHRERDFHRAVADWLNDCGNAPGWEVADLSWLFEDALAVARAYLGESA